MTGKTKCPLVSVDAFIEKIWREGKRHYRSLPWRHIDDAYGILVSEIMLQQTQVSRVLTHWERWLRVFPSIDALAAATLADVLAYWQGMGYNRRAIALKRCADELACDHAGSIPSAYDELLKLPGIGPATATGVCVFAYQIPQVYLETNVRTVFIHEFFPTADKVPDREIIPLVKQTCSNEDPRAWYYAVLDYGAYLKKTLPNPSRRSAHHTRQSTFEGSVRQKRAELLRLVLATQGQGATTEELALQLALFEKAAGRETPSEHDVIALLCALEHEGFLVKCSDFWRIA